MPAISNAVQGTAVACLFVDALLPLSGASWVTRIEELLPPRPGESLRKRALSDLIPNVWCYAASWAEAGVEEGAACQLLAAEARPLPLSLYHEPYPTASSWPATHGAFIQLSSAYAGAADEASRRGWPVRHLGGGHFRTYTDPVAVVDELLAMTARILP